MADKYDITNNGGAIGQIGTGGRGTVSVTAPAAAAATRASESTPTFGIVAALPEEHVPLERLLDGARRTDVPDDRAAYRVGTMPSRDPSRPHGVVLTLSGNTGNAPAADACTNLTRSFPSVQYVVMAGIAAGVPTAGVRRGDVLVSTEGVLDYDHVREFPDRTELRRPFPRPSPLLVRAAREVQMATDEPPAWTEALGRGPAGYQRPGGEPGATPHVHPGLIGSADRSLHNERLRDELVARHRKLVGFEMEGAGIGNSGFLNGLEYLVIRGVSDLGEADRDQDRTWRLYAALAAAAYTRGLLAACVPVTPRGGRTLGVPD
jgi:nucleoside phosphorylase